MKTSEAQNHLSILYLIGNLTSLPWCILLGYLSDKVKAHKLIIGHLFFLISMDIFRALKLEIDGIENIGIAFDV